MKKILFLLLLLLLFILSCKKEYDLAPVAELPEGAELFIKNIRSRIPLSGNHFRFASGDSCLYCTVLADESSGNIYKELFVRDDAGEAIQLKLVNSGGFLSGDRLRIRLHNLYAVNANNMIYIDSVDILKNTVKSSSGNTTPFHELTLSTLLSGGLNTGPHPFQSQLVRIKDIEFLKHPTLSTFADPIARLSGDHQLKDCADNRLLVRTSGFANFAGKKVPIGSGYITGILTQYNERLQLLLRNHNELDMNGPLCSITNPTTAPSAVYLKKDFNDNSITSGGWTTQTVTNNFINWTVSSFSNTPSPFAKISGFISGSNTSSETWLISPAISLTASDQPYLSFQTAAKFPGNLLEVLVSVDYSAGPPSSATWRSLAGNYALSPAPTTGGYVWTASGKVDLSAHASSHLRIAFKYTSSPAGATTYELDDVVVQKD